jgi:hypothetical protein
MPAYDSPLFFPFQARLSKLGTVIDASQQFLFEHVNDHHMQTTGRAPFDGMTITDKLPCHLDEFFNRRSGMPGIYRSVNLFIRGTVGRQSLAVPLSFIYISQVQAAVPC